MPGKMTFFLHLWMTYVLLCLLWALGKHISPIIFNFWLQTALLLISGKDGVMDLIYGGYSFLDHVHITRRSNYTLK